MSFFINFEQISITDYENHDYSPLPNCRGVDTLFQIRSLWGRGDRYSLGGRRHLRFGRDWGRGSLKTRMGGRNVLPLKLVHN